MQNDQLWHYSANCRVPEGQQLPDGIQRYAAVVAYDGSEFCGFQRQSHSPSVQQALEDALGYVADQPLTLACAGRTDSGVHASGQVIHFDTGAVRSGYSWVNGGNTKLPEGISLLWADAVEPQFHARFSALSRTYRYVMHVGKARPAIMAKGVSWIRHSIDLQAMQEAAQLLLGERDYSAFRGAGCQSHSTMRNVMSANIHAVGQLVVFEIQANAFLLHMVRNIVGSLLEVGSGRREPQWIARLLAEGDRRKAAATASGRGLYLVDVEYPEPFIIAPDLQRGPLFLPARL